MYRRIGGLLLTVVLGACASAPSSSGSGSGEILPATTTPATPAATAASPAVPTHRLLPLDREARAWVDSTLAAMTLRERAAQLIMPWMSGKFTPVDSEEWRSLVRWVDAGVGGIVVSIGPPVALADKLNRLQRAAEVPLLIATDMEHGPGQRLEGGVVLPYGMDMGGGTSFPPVMAVGATGDPELAYELGRVTAQEARAVGIHLNFAPVVDVNNNPLNPIINTRSYGGDPATVARFVAQHVRGLQDHGLLATAKHFPGHGDTSGDTHLELQILRIGSERAHAVELVPFEAAIDADVSAVMTAHIAFPALAGDPELPATLSPRMLDSLLIGELDFDGLVVTDALNMGAIVRGYGPVEAPILALEAGADILLMPLDPFPVIEGLAAAVESGRVTEQRLNRSVRKILEAKARVGLHRQRTVDAERVADVVGSEAHRALADRVAEQSITLVRDDEGLVPLPTGGATDVLSITYSDDISPFAANVLHRELAAAVPGLRRIVLEGPAPEAVLDSVAREAEAADLVLFVADVRVRSGKGSVAVDPAVAERIRRIAADRPVVMVSMGNPYLLQQIPEADAYLLAWGSGEASQRAAARALSGEEAITGRLPIPIPPLYEVGAGLERRETRPVTPDAAPLDGAALEELERAVLEAVEARVTPGAVVAIGSSGGPRYLRSFGRVDYAPHAPAATDSTLYDLASLTKVVGTTSGLMLLVDRGQMDLDAPLSRYLDAWPTGGWHDEVTIRRLLAHRGGLPPFRRFWHESEGALRGTAAYVDAIAGLEPSYEPGTRTVYSDLGLILLAAAVADVTGEPLDRFLDRELWTPLGMDDTRFRPLEAGVAGPPVALDRIAPTEVDSVFRNVHVHGVVHDENAYAIGGVAGHAGLFSTAPDLARFARMLLAEGAGPDGRRILSPETVARFTTPDAAGDRALGWDIQPGGGRIAEALSPRAFGHTGFTGTSLWIDPERDLYVVLLTNRVNPTREGPSVTPLRRAVHQHAAEAVDRSDNMEAPPRN